MKKTFTLTCLVLIAASCFASGALLAKPERFELQSDAVRTKKTQAKALAQSVDLTQVEDPEVRTALQAIFSALNLEAKK